MRGLILLMLLYNCNEKCSHFQNYNCGILRLLVNFDLVIVLDAYNHKPQSASSTQSTHVNLNVHTTALLVKKSFPHPAISKSVTPSVLILTDGFYVNLG